MVKVQFRLGCVKYGSTSFDQEILVWMIHHVLDSRKWLMKMSDMQ
jgi:hypothetical protein